MKFETCIRCYADKDDDDCALCDGCVDREAKAEVLRLVKIEAERPEAEKARLRAHAESIEATRCREARHAETMMEWRQVAKGR